ncbi:MAG: hypothetical protein CL828_06160 [Crocinitomicaceae bacterium]|nr:hypothetical protein [Crocinitomicaceae bacterium]
MNFKKTLMAASFAAISMNAAAVVDLDATTPAPLKYADELKGTLTAGKVNVDVNAADTDITVDMNYAFAKGLKVFVRWDLGNALFAAAPTLVVDNDANCGATQAVAASAITQGGDGESFAIFEVTLAEETYVGCDVVLKSADYAVDPTATMTATFSIYDAADKAANQTLSYHTKTGNVASFITSVDYPAVVAAENPVATVASGFTSFDNSGQAGIANGVKTRLATLTADDVKGTAALKLTGATAANSDYITASQNITITGDVSVGSFHQSDQADCAGTTKACTKATDNASCVIASTTAATNSYLCIDLTGITAGTSIAKGAYSVAFAATGEDGMDKAIGSVGYDTTTVEVPYITTYEGYNQRIFLDNRGTSDAYYTTTFTTESGVTATGTAAATGTLPAGEIVTMKVSDLVTFTGGSRGMATMEVEATTANLKVTTQIVDLGTGMTDTIKLN